MQLQYIKLCFLFALLEFDPTFESLLTKAISNTKFDDKKITELSTESFHVKTRTECITLCLSTPSCLACATNRDIGQCSLYGKDFIGIGDTTTVPEVSWKYYFVIPVSERYPNRTGCYQYPDSNEGPCSLYCFDYVSYSTTMNHAAAEAHCASKNGELVKVDRDLKQYCVEQLLGSVTIGRVYAQGKRIHGVWMYNDGSAMTFFKWDISTSQPGPDEDVIVIEPYYNFLWHDYYHSKEQLKAVVCDLH